MEITFKGRAVTLTIREKSGQPFNLDEIIGFRYVDEPDAEHFEKADQFCGGISALVLSIAALPGMDETNCVED